MKKYLFIAGLHRSGTTILSDCLSCHPDISGFKNTGFPKDEGQFLQTVFPAVGTDFGGPGHFGFHKEMHLTEQSFLVNDENKNKLFTEWNRYWDISKSVFLEKSPPNILKLRFLQAMFANAYFVVITRHPVAVSYATMIWSKANLEGLLEHWIKCHDIMLNDIVYLKNVMLLKYEDFVINPNKYLCNIHKFVGIDCYDFKDNLEVDFTKNEKYMNKWKIETNRNELFRKYQYYFTKFGYNLEYF